MPTKPNNKLEIREIKNKTELEECFEIRRIVFVMEQNVSKELEWDGLDNQPTTTHIIVKAGKKTVGCSRIRFVDSYAKLERIAILSEYRGNGYGKRLIKFMVDICKKKKVKTIKMHAQYYLLEYYKKLGFIPFGKKFDEAGIEHIEMRIE